MSEFFDQLESNDKEVIEHAKQKFREQFKNVSESWLLNGLYEYYLKTNSARSLDILVSVEHPHYNFLFDRLCDSIKKPEEKILALHLLGHIARSQTTWLYKLPDHQLFIDVLKLLKHETEVLPLITALLLIIVLLPMLPDKMALYLQDLFEIFSRLAAWNCSPGKFGEDQMIHMQVALYALFIRLYGMYPCNFLEYLKSQYKEKNNPVFIHTIKPMLSNVRMNPAFVTVTKDIETSTERWKKIGVHDVIVECERFSLDLTDRCPHDTCQMATTGFRSRSNTTNSTLEPYVQKLKALPASVPANDSASFYTPSSTFQIQTPPITESAPTAIPHPHVQGVIQSSHFPFQEGTSPPEAAIEATPETTPIRDLHLTPGRNLPLNSSTVRALSNFRGVSLNSTPNHSQPSSPRRKDVFSFQADHTSRDNFITKQKLNKLIQDRSMANESIAMNDIYKPKNLPPPTSPLRINADKRYQFVESPRTIEDEEVLSIVGSKNSDFKQFHQSRIHEHNEATESLDDEQEHGSPCTAGGLHMASSKSMKDFSKKMQRLRHHSQCNPEPERIETSTGSSPGKTVSFSTNTTVRKVSSCPDMLMVENRLSSNGVSGTNKVTSPRKKVVTCSTQTENFMPYEFLFLGIFPSLESNEMKPSPAPSPAPLNISQDRCFAPSIYEILDKYIEIASQGNEKDTVNYLKEQLQLVHQQLMFERHRRETHAYRNRRLLGDAKNIRFLEEYNSALKDQVELQQNDIDGLKEKLRRFETDKNKEEQKLSMKLKYWENKWNSLQEDYLSLKDENKRLETEMKGLKTKCGDMDNQLQTAEASLLDAIAEVNVAREQAWTGEKGRSELEQLNRELLLIGELHLKYQEQLNKLSSMRQCEKELDDLREVYSHEIKELNGQLHTKIALLEAYRSRISELEGQVLQKDQLITTMKQQLNVANDLHFNKIEAIESKYQTQLKINRALEFKLLEIRQKRPVNSPDTSSCHEVNATTTDRTAGGISPHSSPLSASLASSEGSIAFHDKEKEMKNLQAWVEQREPSTSKSKDSPLEGASSEFEGVLSSSTKHD